MIGAPYLYRDISRPLSKSKEQCTHASCHLKTAKAGTKEERGGVGVKLIGERKKHLLRNSLTVASEARLLLFPNKNTHFCVPRSVAFRRNVLEG